MKKDFSVIIPARLASTRLPNKALADIHGKPMVVRTAEQAQKSMAQQVYVATDHLDIINVCQRHGINAILTNNQHDSGTTRLAEAARLLSLPEQHIIVNVQGDEPMIPPELINCVATALDKNNAPMATAAHPIHHPNEWQNPNVVKVILNKKNNALYFSRANIPYPRDKSFPEPMPLRHIGIYAYTNSFLQQYTQLTPSPLEKIENLEQLRVLWHDYPIAVETIAYAPPAGVDTAADLERIRIEFLKQQ